MDSSCFLTAAEAAALDNDLMSVHAFSLDQLMELAGLSVASAALDAQPGLRRPLIICGPGNNGGDGLVAARHLSHFGTTPTVVYPISPKKEIYRNLIAQCKDCRISVRDSISFDTLDRDFDMIIDAMFGFSFHGKIREPFEGLVNMINHSKLPCLAVDIPSGWQIDHSKLVQVLAHSLWNLSSSVLDQFAAVQQRMALR
uniref:NAD(P)H-hydrate epimerase n=1 Tax=Spongospora subterranea TaxID=70186 RepID=A0A0H5QHC4_9EUKA|eukprot:CRZ01410.1 hypothetical protein [Spongospora subterranea]